MIINLSFRGLKWYNRKVCPRAEKLHCYLCSLQQILGTWIDPHWNNVHWEMPYKSFQFVESHGEFQPEKRQINISSAFNVEHIFSKFYGKVVSYLGYFSISFENYVLYWDFNSNSWIVDFFTHFTCEKTPQNNFFCHSVENNYIVLHNAKIEHEISTTLISLTRIHVKRIHKYYLVISIFQ